MTTPIWKATSWEGVDSDKFTVEPIFNQSKGAPYKHHQEFEPIDNHLTVGSSFP